MTALALYVVSRVLLGGDADATLPTVNATFPVLSRHVVRRVASLLPLPHQLPLPNNIRAHVAKSRLFGDAEEIVRRRTSEQAGDKGPDGDLLDLLLAARDPETGAALSQSEIVAQVVTFLLAGHETTAMALTAARPAAPRPTTPSAATASRTVRWW